METKEIGLEIVQIRLIQDRIVYNEKPIHSPQDAVEILGNEIKDYDREVLCVLNLDAHWVVQNANIVSMGTSLPELVTSIVAARKNEVDMALGNAIGSNVFNILMVLGIASAISPISIITENIIDLCVLIVFTICVWIFAGTRKKIGRIEGFSMVVLYLIYAVYIIIR